MFEFVPTLVHSDAEDPSGGQVVASDAPVYGVDHRGVATLQNASGTTTCGGALLLGGEHILTAAHCAGTAQQASFEIGGDVVTVPVVDRALHPMYDGNVFHGYDVAVLSLDGEAPSDIPRYDVNRSLNDLGITGVAVGYGASGHGAAGATVTAGQKRAGLIEFEINAVQSSVIENAHTMLTADFDSGDPSSDAMALYYGLTPDLGFGDDEIGFAPGDSGSPVFQQQGSGWVIAGVASYLARVPAPDPLIPNADVDATKNGSFGEFSAAARVADPNVLGFVEDVAGINGFSPVPEPSSALLVLLGALGLFGRRRRPTEIAG